MGNLRLIALATLLSLIILPMHACSSAQSQAENAADPNASSSPPTASESGQGVELPQEEPSDEPAEAHGSEAAGKSKDETQAITQQGNPPDLETPHYSLTIPDEEKRLCVLEYSSDYDVDPNGLAIGFNTSVFAKGEDWPRDKYAIFSVAIFSDNWGPQGEFYAKPLGHPSKMPGSTAYILQGMFSQDNALLEDQTDEYSRWIEVL